METATCEPETKLDTGTGGYDRVGARRENVSGGAPKEAMICAVWLPFISPGFK